MTLIYFVIEILAGFIDIYVLCKVAEIFLVPKDGRTNVIWVLPYFVGVIKTILDWERVPGIWSSICLILYFVSQFCYLIITYKGKILIKGIITLALGFFEALAEVIVMSVGISLLGLKIQKIQDHGLENVICLLVAKGICIFFQWIIRRIRQVKWSLAPEVLKSLFFLMTVNMSFVMVVYVLYRNITSVTKEVLFLIIGGTILLVAILNIVVFYSMMCATEKNYQASLQFQYMKAQEQQNQNMETVTQNLRQLRHDMNNHLGVLYGLCDTKQYDTLQQYISGIMKETKEANDIIVVPNQPIFSIILNNKRTMAEEKGIRFMYAIQREVSSSAVETDNELPLSEMEQCSLLGNILDNAIEACEKNPQVTERWIHLILEKKEKGWWIICKNAYFEKPVFEGEQLVTQKTDARNHGIGTKTMRSIIKKYNGTLEYQVTEEEFQVKIFLQS